LRRPRQHPQPFTPPEIEPVRETTEPLTPAANLPRVNDRCVASARQETLALLARRPRDAAG